MVKSSVVNGEVRYTKIVYSHETPDGVIPVSYRKHVKNLVAHDTFKILPALNPGEYLSYDVQWMLSVFKSLLEYNKLAEHNLDLMYDYCDQLLSENYKLRRFIND